MQSRKQSNQSLKLSARAAFAILLMTGLMQPAAALIDPENQAVQPCIEQSRNAVAQEGAAPVQADLEKCYRDYSATHKLDAQLPEFAMWVGAFGVMDFIEERARGFFGNDSVRTGGVQEGAADADATHVEAFDLMRAYERNEFNADLTYKDKTVVISGRVSAYHADADTGRPVVEIKGDNFGLFNVYVMLNRDYADGMRLRKDDPVRVRGLIKGINMGMRLDVADAVILSD